VRQRCGCKDRLWHAAIDHGFGQLLADLLAGAEKPAPDDTAKLHAMIVRFVEATAARPALARIIHQEAASGGARFDYLYGRYIKPVQRFGETVLQTLHARSEIRTSSVGLVYFLMTHGAGGPPTFPALARRLGVHVDRTNPNAVRRHAVEVVDILFEGLRKRY